MACRLSSAAEEFADRLGDDSVRQDDRHVEHGEGVAVPLGKADAVEHVSFTPSEPTIHRLNRRSLQCQLPTSGEPPLTAPVEPSQSSGLGNGSCLISDIRSTIRFWAHLGSCGLSRVLRGEGKRRNDKIDIGGWLHGWGSNATARRSATNQIDHDLFRSLTAENPKDRSVVLGIEHFSTAPRRLAKPTADADGVCQGAV
jgi:hypothetical protein